MPDAPRVEAVNTRPPASGRWDELSRGGLGVVALLLVTFVTYSAALQNGFIWDDPEHVVNNPTLPAGDGLRRIWFELGATPQYYPLTFTSFWIEYRLWGLNPAGYHCTNILLHALNAILVWRLLRRLGVPGAWVAACIFAVHPVHVESVAWITERKNTLSTLFYLLALRVYLGFRPLDEGAAARAGSIPAYVGALVCFVAAGLSKSVTCSWPAAMLLLTWWRRGHLAWRDVLPLVPFFVLGVVFALNTVLVERHDIGAEGPEWNLSLVQRVLIAGRAVWFYAGKLLWPAPLVFTYPRWVVDPGQWWQYVYPLAAAVVLFAAWQRRQQLGRGPLAALLFFGGTLVPALGFFNVYPMLFSYVADHFQYVASLGVITLVVAAVTSGIRRTGVYARALGPLLTLTAIVVLGYLTYRQTRIYHGQESLWRDTLVKNPDAWMANYNLGELLDARGDRQAAITCYEAALRTKPDHRRSRTNLGVAYAQLGLFDKAEAHLKAAIANDPQDAVARQTLGIVYARLGLTADAAHEFAEAVRLAPGQVELRVNLAMNLLSQGRWNEAVEQLADVVRRRPELATQLENQPQPALLDALAGAYAEMGKFDGAIRVAQRAVDLARRAGAPALAERIDQHLTQYRAGKPSREP